MFDKEGECDAISISMSKSSEEAPEDPETGTSVDDPGALSDATSFAGEQTKPGSGSGSGSGLAGRLSTNRPISTLDAIGTWKQVH